MHDISMQACHFCNKIGISNSVKKKDILPLSEHLDFIMATCCH